MDLFLHGQNLLSDDSLWGDDFSHLLDDGLGDGVHSHMGLIGGLGFLERSLGWHMSVLNVNWSGLGGVD